MIKVEDMYISLNNIRTLKYEDNGISRYLIIEYWDEYKTKIKVQNEEKYCDLAEMILARVSEENKLKNESMRR